MKGLENSLKHVKQVDIRAIKKGYLDNGQRKQEILCAWRILNLFYLKTIHTGLSKHGEKSQGNRRFVQRLGRGVSCTPQYNHLPYYTAPLFSNATTPRHVLSVVRHLLEKVRRLQSADSAKVFEKPFR